MTSQVRNGDHTRDRILEAAVELFGRDGFDRTTVRAIAKRCGITDAALYYHFRSKRNILTALWDLPRLASDTEQAAGPARPLNYERLEAIVDQMVTVSAQHDALVRLLIRSVLNGDQTASALRESTMASWRMALLREFESAFDREEAEIRVEALMMLYIGFICTAQIEHGDRFAEVSEYPEFRNELKHLVNLSVPLPVGVE